VEKSHGLPRKISALQLTRRGGIRTRISYDYLKGKDFEKKEGLMEGQIFGKRGELVAMREEGRARGF